MLVRLGQVITFGMAALLPTLVSAQGAASAAEWEKIVAAARKEGRAVAYVNSLPNTNDRLRDDFAKAYPGIVLEINRIVGPPIGGRVEEERKSGVDGADLAITGESVFFLESAKQGLIRRPIGPAAAAWPEKFMLGGVAPALNMEPFIIVYNTNLVKAPVTGYMDLLRPEFKDGKVGTSEPVGPILLAWYDWLDKLGGGGWVAKFADQKPKLYIGVVPTTQSVASGELLATALSMASTAGPLLEKGAPIKLVVPNPPLLNAYFGGVLSWAKRPNAAIVVMDYLMSVRGQTVWNGIGGQASALSGIPNTLDSSKLELTDLRNYPNSAIGPYRDKWNRMFKAQ
jgi:ABC-type Fe3+ transport system substrate-binding protein